MRALLIDPYAFLKEEGETVTEIDIEESLAGMYRALSDEEHDFKTSLVEVATEDASGHVYWVDEEGLMQGHSGFVVLEGAHQPFAGRVLVTGQTPDGGTSEATLDVEALSRRVATLMAAVGIVGINRQDAAGTWSQSLAVGSLWQVGEAVQRDIDAEHRARSEADAPGLGG